MSRKSFLIFRLCIGGLLLLDLFQRFQFLDIYYGESGYYPQELAKEFYQGYWPPFEFLENLIGIGGILLLTATTTILYMGGLWFRITGLLTFFLMTSLNFRNPLILSGGDLLLRTILFWSLFFSHKKEKENALVWFSYFCQLFIIYFFATWLKLLDPAWRSGDALSFILRNPGNATALGLKLSQMKPLMVVMNYSVLLLQGVLPIVLLLDFRSRRLTKLIATLFILFHVGIALMMKLGAFPYVSIISWLPVFLFKVESDTSRTRGLLALSFIFVVLLINLSRIPRSSVQLPAGIRKVVIIMGLSQKWSMFSQARPYETWLQMPAVMLDKSEKNIFPGIFNDRDLKYFSNLEEERHPLLFAAFAKVACRLPVYSFEIIQARASLDSVSSPKFKSLYSHNCKEI